MQDALGDVTNKSARKKGAKQATKVNTAGVSTSDRPKITYTCTCGCAAVYRCYTVG